MKVCDVCAARGEVRPATEPKSTDPDPYPDLCEEHRRSFDGAKAAIGLAMVHNGLDPLEFFRAANRMADEVAIWLKTPEPVPIEVPNGLLNAMADLQKARGNGRPISTTPPAS